MGFPVPAYFFSLLICGLLSTNVFALVGSRNGAWGYSHFPSASLMEEGNASLFGGAQRSTTTTQYGGLLYSPLSLLEVGAAIDREPKFTTGLLSLKVQVPRMDTWQPLLSIGVLDLAMDNRRWENLYFVGGYALSSGDMILYLDLGAIYHRQQNGLTNQVTSYLAGAFDFGLISLMMEASRSSEGIGLIPSLWLKPTFGGLYMGAGMEWQKKEPKSLPNPWGEVGVQIPLGSLDLKSSNPWFYFDFNPVCDHYYSASMNQYQTYLDIQGVMRTRISGLYWVNAASLSAVHSNNSDALAKHNIWDRSYVLFDRDQEWGDRFRFRAPQVGAGMLMEHTLGLTFGQEFRHRSWNPLVLDLSVFRGDVEGHEATLQLPLHPKGPSILKWIQLYGEGGEYLSEGKLLFGGMKIGSQDNFLDGAIGYSIEEKQLLARVDFRMNLSHWTQYQAGPVQIRGLNRVEHRLHVVANDLDAVEFSPSISGNPRHNRPHYPWTPPKEKPEKKNKASKAQKIKDADWDGIPDASDACPFNPEDKDAYQDQDGCPDLDNDGDRVADSQDKCPFEAEDEDLFSDEDGCPDYDNDKDGIPDSLDACVNSAEDIDGYLDSDGCPDPDNDHDGIRDGEDACPNQVGTYILGNPRNGCPEGDDNDGIPFELDACPNAAEDYDGFQDSDGCPDP